VLLVAPVVSPRITNIPSGSGTAGPGQASGSSMVHVAEQPSAGLVLPSSHCSPPSTAPLPHVGPPELELCPLLLLLAALLLLVALELMALELDEDDELEDVPDPLDALDALDALCVPLDAAPPAPPAPFSGPRPEA